MWWWDIKPRTTRSQVIHQVDVIEYGQVNEVSTYFLFLLLIFGDSSQLCFIYGELFPRTLLIGFYFKFLPLPFCFAEFLILFL